jgi:hypothetical protein
MKQLPLYIIIVLLLVLFTCNPKTKETVRVKTFRDTIVRVDTVVHSNLQVDTVIVLDYDTIINGIAFDVNQYEYKIEDSLLIGTIRATSPIKPIINFDYYLKSFEIKDSVHVIKSDLRGFYYGGDIIISPMLKEAYIGLGYMNKKGDLLDISVGKEFSTNTNLIKLGFKKRF